jgi:hypothetical protein
MGKRSTKGTIQYWRQHVEAFNASGLTRDAYSKKNRIRVYQLDYWRKKISRKEKAPESIAAKQWVPVKISDEPAGNDSNIDLWIGSIRIEVRKGFDSRLLIELIRAVGAGC